MGLVANVQTFRAIPERPSRILVLHHGLCFELHTIPGLPRGYKEPISYLQRVRKDLAERTDVF